MINGSNDGVQRAAHHAGDNPVIEWGARLGYAANGLIHLLLAWLTLQIAFGNSSGQASQSGALAEVAKQPWGKALLWPVVAGFVLLALWQITEIITRRKISDKAKAGGKAVVYLALGVTAFQFAHGSGTSSNKQTRDFTRTVMDWPGGRLIVAAIGIGILGVAAYHVYKGWKKKFLGDLQEHPGSWAVYTGRTGYILKGTALAAVGVLFVIAAVRRQEDQATGLDGALRALRDLPAGTALLVLIAIGLAAYGAYSFARARYARV
ncbi:DUF1206 domain-containing protein [Kineosporia mesophila]|uniref:DUF1206 domain-containing protein n=1 Tax=Kineosporia mesophila TaxID=566012 RepID=A0ABP7AHW6_9ACTN|nr:DUF1206 domain-containing protein [Kineosporia mesophila]MCD5350775.1 DUF1206 domain-containing protein [Kineosporia mesophila]